MVVVPARGANLFVRFVDEDSAFFRVVGGFSQGDIIRSIVWSWAAVTAGEIVLAAVLGGSRSETIAGLEAGSELLDRFDLSFLTGSRIGSYRFNLIAGGVGGHRQFIGREVQAGSNFITFGFATTASGFVSVAAGVEVVRIARGAGEK